MMCDFNFDGYISFPAKEDDELREKWNAVHYSLLDAALMPVAFTLDGLARMNEDYNHAVAYRSELSGKDFWQRPKDTLLRRTGDCEDFAILKYAALLKSGMDENNLRISLGQIKSIEGNQDHAWCAVYLDDWRVLDVKFPQVIRSSEYINWLPLAACWSDKVMRYGREVMLSA